MSGINLIKTELPGQGKGHGFSLRGQVMFYLLFPAVVMIFLTWQSGYRADLVTRQAGLQLEILQATALLQQHQATRLLEAQLLGRAEVMASLQQREVTLMRLLLVLPGLLPDAMHILRLQRRTDGWLLEAESLEHEAIGAFVKALGEHVSRHDLKPLRMMAEPDASGHVQLRFALEWPDP